jgi:hypothetical protein
LNAQGFFRANKYLHEHITNTLRPYSTASSILEVALGSWNRVPQSQPSTVPFHVNFAPTTFHVKNLSMLGVRPFLRSFSKSCFQAGTVPAYLRIRSTANLTVSTQERYTSARSECRLTQRLKSPSNRLCYPNLKWIGLDRRMSSFRGRFDHLATFFAQYSTFTYNKYSSPTNEFYRLCRHQGW